MATSEGIRVTFTGDASSLDAASKKATSALGKVQKSSVNTTQAAVNFGRVLQDLPYGIQGVANNIDPLVASLGGPAGLGIAVAATTTALILWGDKLFKAETAATRFSTGLKDLLNVQKNMQDVQSDAAEAAGEELSRLTILNKVATDTSASMKTRLQAVQALKKEFPDYLQSLKDEAILNGKAAEQINLAKDAILAKARAEAASKKVAELSGKLLELDIELEKADVQRLNAKINLDNQLKKTARDEVKGMAAVNTATVQYQTQVAKTTGKVNELKEAQKTLRAELDRFADFATTNAKKAPADFFNLSKPKEIKAEVPELKLKVARVGLTFSEMLIEKSSLNNRFDIAGLIDTGKLPAPSLPSIKLPEPDPKQISRIEKTLLDLAGFFEEVGQSITLSLGNAFAGLFDNIMSGSQSAFQAFGAALGNIIKKLLATAAAAAILTLILGPLGLIKGGASGTEILKGFKLFQNIFGKIGGFAEGGVVSGPQSGYPAILHGKEVIAPFDKFMNLMQGAQSNSDGRLTLEVRGEKLLFAVDRARRGRNIIG